MMAALLAGAQAAGAPEDANPVHEKSRQGYGQGFSDSG